MIRVRLIGCEFFAVNQMQGWADARGARVTAICDRDPERLAAMGARFGIERRYDDDARMMREEELDVADIATTVSSHHPLVEAAARAGLHVICQKPFAETLEDARAMVAAMEAAGRTLMGTRISAGSPRSAQCWPRCATARWGGRSSGGLAFVRAMTCSRRSPTWRPIRASSSRTWESTSSISPARCSERSSACPPATPASTPRSAEWTWRRS